MNRPVTNDGMRGFTFFEMLAVLVILMIVGGVGFQAIQMTSTASAATVFRTDLDQRAHRAVTRIVRELQDARLKTLMPEPIAPFGASTLSYVCAEVPDEETIVWGEYRRLELVPSATDPLDGRDNDHDGLTDEHVLRLVHDVGLISERTMVLVRNVAARLEGEAANALDDNGNGLIDEAGLSISVREGVLHVRLSLQGRDPKGNVATRTAETTVWPRN
jgi:hypothetical protein